MSIQKSILYVGEDESLFSKIEIFCEARIRTDFIIQQTNYKPGSLIEHITSDLPNIIYIDFTEIEKYTDILVQEIIFLKQYNRFRSIMFAAILPNEKNKEQFPQLFTSGFQ